MSARTVGTPAVGNRAGGSRNGALLLAGTLMVGGVVLLLLNLNVLERWEPVAHYIVTGALALGGIAFFASAQAARAWQRIIPAWTLLALALMVLLGERENPNTRLVAATLFWGLAAAFFHILLLARRENWWALIPGGFMVVLGSVIALSGVVQSLEMLAALLFGGLGIVFFAVYFLSVGQGHWWALLPGSILAIFSLFVLTGAGEGGGLVRWWPLLLIVVGALVAWRAWTAPVTREPDFEQHHAPAMRTGKGEKIAPAERQELGEYSQPAPGTTIDLLADEE